VISYTQLTSCFIVTSDYLNFVFLGTDWRIL